MIRNNDAIRKTVRTTTLVAVTASALAGTALGAEAPGEVSVAKDLTAVIALQGLPCGKVVSAAQKGEDDYVVTCEDGNRYRVSVNPDGRVTVRKVD